MNQIRFIGTCLTALSLLMTESAFSECNVLETHKGLYEEVQTEWGVEGNGVIEFFSYNCSVCFTARSAVETFLQNKPAELTYRAYHVSSGRYRSWAMSQMAFDALHTTGKLSSLHERLYEYFHTEGAPGFDTVDDIREYFQNAGADDEVLSAVGSKRSTDFREMVDGMARDISLRQTPTFVINGRYKLYYSSDLSDEEYAKLILALAAHSPMAGPESCTM